MNMIGSKTLETKRLILRSSNMYEQKRLWEILMMPDVNKWYLTGHKKYANDLNHWSWDMQEKFYKSKVLNAKNSELSENLNKKENELNELKKIISK